MSLKQIAQLAGTSISTVSRVLNDPTHTCNNPELYDRIWRIAGELNYTPNHAARNLRLGEEKKASPFKVDVFLTRFHSLESDVFFMELFQIIREELLAADCVFGELLTNIDIMNLGRKEKEQKHIPYRSSQALLEENLQNTVSFITKKPDTGLVILGKCPEQLIPILQKRYDYVVGIDRNPTSYLYDEVVCDGATAAEMALEYLISLGHKNIAYIGDCTYEARYVGYYQTLLKHKLPLNYKNVYPTGQTQAEGTQVMLSILKEEKRPSAIFCANDTTAIGVLEALKKRKHRGYMPSIVSIDNIEMAQRTSPMLTSIDIPKREMGHLAILTLLDRRNGYHEKNVRIELPCRLVKRESCRPVGTLS